mgnify:FL=1
MQNLSDINQIKSLLSRHGFSFSKALGQNFIIDADVCPNMADAAVPNNSYGVIEIGPGIGVLTVELAKRAKKVISVELDTRLLPILDETLSDYDNVKIINSDVMKLDLHKVIEEEFAGMPVVICANLPYYITSPIIMMLLESKLPIESVTVMVQAEAADRLCAPVGTRDAGAVTVAVNFYAEAEELFFVPREAFIPSPKVDSKVMRLKVRETASFDIKNEKAFLSMVKGAFSMRRKTIMNSIPAGINTSKEKLESVLSELEISKTARIEQLTMDELIEIYNRLS